MLSGDSPYLSDGIIGPARRVQIVKRAGVRLGGFRIKLDNMFKFAVRCGPIPIVKEIDRPHGRMCLGKLRCEIERLLRVKFRDRKRLFRPHVINSECDICIGQTCVRQSVIRIFFDRLIKICNGFLVSALGLFVPVKRSFQIQVIGLRVFGIAFRKLLLVRRRQFDPQFIRNIAGNFFLQGNNVCQLAVIPPVPDRVPGLCIRQFQAQRQLLATLDDAAGEDRLHVQISSQLLQVSSLTLVVKYHRTRLYAKIRQLGQAADQRLGYPVRKVLDLRVSAFVYKGHHGDRLDLLCPAAAIETVAANAERANKQNADHDRDRRIHSRRARDWICSIWRPFRCIDLSASRGFGRIGSRMQYRRR